MKIKQIENTKKAIEQRIQELELEKALFTDVLQRAQINNSVKVFNACCKVLKKLNRRIELLKTSLLQWC